MLSHGHDFYELDIITGGKAIARTNGNNESAESGSIYFLTPEDFHEYSNTENFSLVNIQFFGDDISPLLLRSIVDTNCRVFNPANNEFNLILTIFEMMERVNDTSDFSADILPRFLESILIILHGCLNIMPEVKTNLKCEMQTALVYIQEHFRENPPLSLVANLLSYNERYFCKKFKDYTGRTYKEYLRHKKLQYARKLILSTSLSIIDICEKCGYNTQSHFNREFHIEYGISPLSLRKSEYDAAKKASR